MSFNRLLLIIAGESFREGGQGSRSKDTPKSLTSQLLACDSHIKFIEHLKNKYNIDVDIQLISYHTKYKKELIEKYNQYNLQYKFYDQYYGDRTQLINSWKLEDIDKSYDSILAIRPDMFLKDFFLDAFNPYAVKVLYPSICFIGMDRIGNIPRVNDTMIFIPKKYFKLIYYLIGLKVYHEAIRDYINHSNRIAKPLTLSNDFDFFLNTLHDSDSAKDYNPIYYLVSRPQNKKWHSYGYEIRDIDFLPMETSKNYTFSDWSIIDNLGDIQYHQIKNMENTWEWWHDDGGYNKFINLIDLNFKLNNNYNIVNPTRCHLETYWSLKDNYKLYFYDKNKIITSILFKKNEYEFAGKSMVSNAKFYLKKKV
jgi:hypothetical protein